MEIGLDRHDQNMVVALKGRLDVLASRDLEAQLTTVIDVGITTLIIDMSNLEYIGSAGLGILVTMGKKVRANGGDMVFASADPNLVKILEICGVTKLFKVVASTRDALAAN